MNMETASLSRLKKWNFLNYLIICIFIIFALSQYVLAEVPKPSKNFPKGELGRMIKLGNDILNHTNTHPLTKNLVGNSLQCVNCHTARSGTTLAGSSKNIGTLIGTAAVFPAYSLREKTIQTLQNRAGNCFLRSMNGTRPVTDSKASLAIASYITWLSSGLKIEMNEKSPTGLFTTKRYTEGKKRMREIQQKATHDNYLDGKKMYTQKCAACHQTNGKGIPGAFPPLWGNKSFNTGAGMSKLEKSAIWIQSNMPKGNPNSLSDIEAANIALYMNSQNRDTFDLSKKLRSYKGIYNSKVLTEISSVRSNFKLLGLDIDKIRNDKLIP